MITARDGAVRPTREQPGHSRRSLAPMMASAGVEAGASGAVVGTIGAGKDHRLETGLGPACRCLAALAVADEHDARRIDPGDLMQRRQGEADFLLPVGADRRAALRVARRTLRPKLLGANTANPRRTRKSTNLAPAGNPVQACR